MSKELMYVIWSAFAGALIPVLAASNGTLGRTIGSPLYASLVAVLLAVVAVCVPLLVTRPAIPSGTIIAAAPLWSWIGGLAMGFYALSATYLAPRFGVGNFVMSVVVAQLVMSSLIDQFGWFGARATRDRPQARHRARRTRYRCRARRDEVTLAFPILKPASGRSASHRLCSKEHATWNTGS